MIEARWEHGSDLHWMQPSGVAVYPWAGSHSLFGCGRFALNALVEHNGWRRMWVPSFYCPEVIASLPRTRLALSVYRDTPAEPLETLSNLDVKDGDVILVSNTFGLRGTAPTLPPNVSVVEDHTHDLSSDWAFTSRADYCVASLRKILPVPDGGVVWSPAGKSIPPEPELDPEHATAALNRLSGSLLKAAFLEGGSVDKAQFRSHSVTGEQALAKGPTSTVLPMTKASLPGFPLTPWRTARASNFQTFCDAVGPLGGTRLLHPTNGAVPYVVTLCFESSTKRDEVRAQLIAARIYPAVLWAMDHAVTEVPADDLDLSRRILSLHCDQRYTSADMQRVASVVGRALS